MPHRTLYFREFGTKKGPYELYFQKTLKKPQNSLEVVDRYTMVYSVLSTTMEDRMHTNNKNYLDTSSVRERKITNRGISESVEGLYEKRYLHVLDSAVSEAEKLLKDAKHLLQNQL
jgi:hypothetical protein